MPSSPDTDVLIIGAGHNGLVCAYYLAAKGLKVTLLERRHVVGGAAVTEEFHPGFRNSTAAYTVSLLNPKVIEDMRLYEHGLEVVLRKMDNFLPTLGPDHLLSGRDGLTRREIARHSPADAEGYDAYSAALGSVVAILRDWILRAPPNAGGGIADVLAALKLGNAVRGMTAEEQRNLLDFFTKSAADILDRYFSHRHRPGPVRLRRGGRQLRQPLRSRLRLRPPPPSVRRGGRGCRAPGAMRSAAWARSPRRWRRPRARKGVEIVLDLPVDEIIVERGRAAGAVAGGKAWRAKAVAANVNPALPVREPAARTARSRPRSPGGWPAGAPNPPLSG